MADEQIEDVVVDNALSTALQNAAFGEDVSQSQTDNTPIVAETSATEVTPTSTENEDEIVEPNAYLKNKWGWESEEAADQEIKTLKEKAERAFEYKNEESKRVAEYINEGKEDELYSFLSMKKAVEKLSSAEISDTKTAAELVKFGIQKDNPNLKPDEVDFLFNERYNTPSKPIQGDIEEDAEYQARVQSWEVQVSNIERRMIIEAKMQQPKLAQLKTELVLPEIQRNIQQSQPSQKDLDDFKKLQDDFNQSAQKSINDFNGFSVQVKDKDVDYTVSYAPSQEEKSLVNEKIKLFSDKGFDANALFADRWLGKEKNTLNSNQMAEDLLRIFGGSKVDSKLATDAANKRIEAFLKDKKQINVESTTKQGTLNLNKNNAETVSDKLREVMFG